MLSPRKRRISDRLVDKRRYTRLCTLALKFADPKGTRSRRDRCQAVLRKPLGNTFLRDRSSQALMYQLKLPPVSPQKLQVRLPSTRPKCCSTRHSTDTMDINNSALSSSDPKTQVINQFRQEIAVNNARQLISVRDCFRPIEQPFDMYVCLSCWSTESQ